MTQRRHNTNLSDASQSSSADSQFNTSSMAAQAPRSPRPMSPRPMSPRPMTRSGLEEALTNAPIGFTADDLRAVNANGERGYDNLLSGMLTANDPDASSLASFRPPTRSEHHADDTTHPATRSKHGKRPPSEMDGMSSSEKSQSRRIKKPKLKRVIERVDECFPKNGQSSGTATKPEIAGEQDGQANREHDTDLEVDGHLSADSKASRERTPKTPSSNRGDEEGST